MAIYKERAKITLEVYLERGREALQALDARDLEKAIKLLSLRKAAFNNFRYWDYVCLQNEPGYSKLPEFQSLWLQIESINKSLSYHLDKEHENLHRDLVVSRGARAKISKFKAKATGRSGFYQGV